MDMAQVVFVPHDTDVTPNTGETSAGSSIVKAGPPLRAASALAAQALLNLASTSLGVATGSLTVKSGVVSGGGKSVSYGALLGGKLFNVQAPASYNMTQTTASPPAAGPGVGTGAVGTKAVSSYTLVGTSPPRIDIPAKVSGTYTYAQNVRVPGMLHGRRVLPRGQMVFGFNAPIVSVDESSISHLPGARVVRQNNFIGVVAPKEFDAIQAAAQLKVVWADAPEVLPGNGNTFGALRAQDSAGQSIQSIKVNTGDVGAGLASAAHVNTQTYGFPFNSLQGIGPQCAIADCAGRSDRVLQLVEPLPDPKRDQRGSRTARPISFASSTTKDQAPSVGSRPAIRMYLKPRLSCRNWPGHRCDYSTCAGTKPAGAPTPRAARRHHGRNRHERESGRLRHGGVLSAIQELHAVRHYRRAAREADPSASP